YDVMVPLTGGKDSVFALYCMTRMVPGLRVLAFTWDHGFNEEQAWQNIHQAVKKTGVDHLVYRIGGSEEIALKLILGFHKTFGCPCEVCVLQHFVIPKTALELEIPLVPWGIINGQNGVNYRRGLHPYTRQDIHDSLFLGLQVFKTVLQFNLKDQMNQILTEMSAPFKKALASENDILFHNLTLGYYFNWNLRDQEIVKLLHDEFGFIKPKDEMTHTSCKLAQIRGYREYTCPPKKGLPFLRKAVPGPMELETNIMVREGIISRERGFKELEAHAIGNVKPVAVIEEYNRITGIDMATFDRYFSRQRPPFKFIWFGIWQLVLSATYRVVGIFSNRNKRIKGTVSA
ncbi:MAG TPA: hypothetical protein VHY08_29325, partial [Bacillota bacterium]|nr:hypothetical protein [Bacillota bacterium]